MDIRQGAGGSHGSLGTKAGLGLGGGWAGRGRLKSPSGSMSFVSRSPLPAFGREQSGVKEGFGASMAWLSGTTRRVEALAASEEEYLGRWASRG